MCVFVCVHSMIATSPLLNLLPLSQHFLNHTALTILLNPIVLHTFIQIFSSHSIMNCTSFSHPSSFRHLLNLLNLYSIFQHTSHGIYLMRFFIISDTDIKTKRNIFKIHTGRMSLSDDVDLEVFVMSKDDLSGDTYKLFPTHIRPLSLVPSFSPPSILTVLLYALL